MRKCTSNAVIVVDEAQKMAAGVENGVYGCVDVRLGHWHVGDGATQHDEVTIHTRLLQCS